MDGGRTWLDRQVVWDDGPNTVGNPCVVEDEATRTLWLLLTHNLGEDREQEIIAGTSRGTRTVWITRSLDEGESWDTPREITADTKLPAWTWYATGPGVGIRLRQEPFRGRLVIPCDHDGPDGYRSHVIYSDDGGASWTLGGATEPGTNECQVVERPDGTLLLNMRTHGGILQTNQRMVAISRDGGESWDSISEDPGLPEPHCQGSLIRVMASDSGDRRLLFANPASTEDRVAMTVRLSEDDGGTWAASYLVHPGPSAYSCLACPDGRSACLREGRPTPVRPSPSLDSQRSGQRRVVARSEGVPYRGGHDTRIWRSSVGARCSRDTRPPSRPMSGPYSPSCSGRSHSRGVARTGRHRDSFFRAFRFRCPMTGPSQ